MVAITLMTIAIVAPMLLTVQSLASAYYSRDQITAFYLAQEAIEEVHQIRDNNILKIAEGQSGINIFDGIPSISGQQFTVDAHNNTMALCSTNPCQALQTSGGLYGYATGWTNTNFTRVAVACYVQPAPSTLCNGTPSDEVRIAVTVSWHTGSFQTRTFTISEDLYRWIQDVSAT